MNNGVESVKEIGHSLIWHIVPVFTRKYLEESGKPHSVQLVSEIFHLSRYALWYQTHSILNQCVKTFCKYSGTGFFSAVWIIIHNIFFFKLCELTLIS